MSNIPHLAARREKRAGKIESFNIVTKLINDNKLTDLELATIYSYFLPPKSKKIKNVFEWLTIPCDDKSSYSFCKYIYVISGCVQSANTTTAHLIYDDLGLNDGCWYDTQKGSVGDDVAIMPDVFAALSNSQNDGIYSNFDINKLDVKNTTKGLCYILPWNGKGVNKNYFDIMFASLIEPLVTYTHNGAFCVSGTVEGKLVSSIIMPFTVIEIS